MMHSFLKTTFSIFQNAASFAPSPKAVILPSASIYASLQSHKLALNLMVLNLGFFCRMHCFYHHLFQPNFFRNLDGSFDVLSMKFIIVSHSILFI